MRSACSVFVGMPVDGPARWMFRTTRGSSAVTARPMPSLLSAIPGPLAAVVPIGPANDVPHGEATARAREIDTGTARGGDADGPAERGADGRGDGGDLVLGLDGPHAEA